jgi:hypothetical protein
MGVPKSFAKKLSCQRLSKKAAETPKYWFTLSFFVTVFSYAPEWLMLHGKKTIEASCTICIKVQALAYLAYDTPKY